MEAFFAIANGLDKTDYSDKFDGLEAGRTECAGDGVVTTPYYWQGILVATKYATNGTNPIDEGECYDLGWQWYATSPDEVEIAPSPYRCQYCGYEEPVDEKYASECPSSAPGHYWSLIARHEEYCESNPEVIYEKAHPRYTLSPGDGRRSMAPWNRRRSSGKYRRRD